MKLPLIRAGGAPNTWSMGAKLSRQSRLQRYHRLCPLKPFRLTRNALVTADDDARHWLLGGVTRSLMASCGRKRDAPLSAEELALILPGLVAWISGKPLCEVERALGGNPDFADDAEKTCPRARELVGTVVPRGLSFIVGLVSHVVEEVDPFDQQQELEREVIECLGPAVRKGYDTPAKVFLASDTPSVLSRVQVHRLASRHGASE